MSFAPYTPKSQTDILADRGLSSVLSQSPNFTLHRVAEAVDSADVTSRALGMVTTGYSSVVVRVSPGVTSDVQAEVMFWSETDGKFVSVSPKMEFASLGAGVPFEFRVRAHEQLIYIFLTGSIGGGEDVKVSVAGTAYSYEAPITVSGVLLEYADATYANASPRYLLDTLNAQVLGPFAGGTPALTTYDGHIYAQIEEARENLLFYSHKLDQVAGGWLDTAMASRTATTDPLGGSTAYNLIGDVGDASHNIYQTKTPDGSSLYTLSCVAEKRNQDWVYLLMDAPGFAGDCWVWFNLNTGVVATTGGGIVATGITPIGGNRYHISATALSDAGVASNIAIGPSDGDGDWTYVGDGATPNTIIWNPQLEIGAFPSSPIKTEAAAVVRAKDQVSWAAAVVPAAMYSGKWATKMALFGTELEVNNTKFYDNAAVGNNDIREFGGDLQVRLSGVLKVGVTVEWSRNTLLTKTVDAAAGALTLAGFNVGDGTTVGTAWEWVSGVDVSLGNDVAGNFQINGLIVEPYKKAP